jgi:hypothetical protein
MKKRNLNISEGLNSKSMKSFSQLANEILINKPLSVSAGGINSKNNISSTFKNGQDYEEKLFDNDFIDEALYVDLQEKSYDGITFINNKSLLLLSQQDEIESNESEESDQWDGRLDDLQLEEMNNNFTRK